MSVPPGTLLRHSEGNQYLPGGAGSPPITISPCAVCQRPIRDVQPLHVYLAGNAWMAMRDVCSFRCALVLAELELLREGC